MEWEGNFYDIVTYELELDATLAQVVAGPRPERGSPRSLPCCGRCPAGGGASRA